MNIPILTTLTEARVDQETCVVEGVILASGASENGTYYPPEVVEKSAPFFVGVQCYADHPRPGESERSVRDVVGAIEAAWAESGRIWATMRLSRAHEWLLTMISEGLVGDLSINALGRTRVARRDGRVVREVVEISKAHSVDFVARAAAGGRVERIIRESAGYAEALRLLERLTVDELGEARPDLLAKVRDKVREELTAKGDEGLSEIEKLEGEIERRRSAFKRELAARRLVEGSRLPEKVREYLLREALGLQVESEDEYESAVAGLIERYRNHLAAISSEGFIRGMGSEKERRPGQERARRETLRLMGIE